MLRILSLEKFASVVMKWHFHSWWYLLFNFPCLLIICLLSLSFIHSAWYMYFRMVYVFPCVRMCVPVPAPAASVFMHVEAGHQPQTLFPLLSTFAKRIYLSIMCICMWVCAYVTGTLRGHKELLMPCSWSRLTWALRTELGSWKSTTLF